MSDSKQYFLVQVFGYLPGTIIPLVCGLIFSVVFTRIISAEEFGKFNLQVSNVTFVVALLSQWLQQSANRYLPKSGGVEAVESLRKAFSLGIFLNTTFMLVGYTLVRYGFGLGRHMFPWSAFLLALGMSVFIPLSVVFQADRIPKLYSFYVSLSAIGKVLFSFLLIYVFGRYAGSLILGAALAYIVIIPGMWRSARLKVSAVLMAKWGDSDINASLGRLLRYGLPLSVWFLLFNFLLFGDRYVVAYFVGNSAVGVYTAGFSLILGCAGLVATPILLGAHPMLIHAWESREIEQVRQLIPQIIRLTFIVGAVLIGGLFLLAESIARVLLGTAFQHSASSMPFMMLGVALSQVAVYAHKPLEFGEHCWEMVSAMVVACLFAFGLNWVLVPHLGYQVAPIAMSVGFAVYSGCVWFLGQKVLTWRIRWSVMSADLGLIALVVLASRLARFGLSILLPQSIGVGLSALLYGGLVFVLLRLRGGRSLFCSRQ